MKCPQYAKVEDKQYKINTDFRVAIKCNEIAQDETIGNFERALAIIYMLFGEEALNDSKHYEKLLELAKKYLSCGVEIEQNDEEPDMDYVKDMDLIEASFMSDFHIDLTKEEMDWWKFNKLINGLSNSELGNCCILNRIRNLRNFDTSKIENAKEREEIVKAKKYWALDKKEIELTDEQDKNAEEFLKQMGF